MSEITINTEQPTAVTEIKKTYEHGTYFIIQIKEFKHYVSIEIQYEAKGLGASTYGSGMKVEVCQQIKHWLHKQKLMSHQTLMDIGGQITTFQNRVV